jgi:RimJ/RimL family protein N-acetyltransferase
VNARIPALQGASFGPCSAIGVAGVSGAPLAGVVFHDYQPAFATIQLSFAADSPRWATRGMVKQLLSYPFEQLAVRKVWAAVPHTHDRALKLIKGLGFVQEAVLKHHFGNRTHAVMWRLLKEDYRLRYGDVHGKKFAETTRCA